jgi:HK97 family phage portal protein
LSVETYSFLIANENLLHIKFFNPLNDWYGFGPLQVAIRAIDQHNAMSDHNIAILQNGGRPSGCLMVKNGTENLTDEQREQLRSDIRNAYAGSLNAGKMMVLEGSFEWKEMGLSPKDLDFGVGKNIASREIAQAFGVPPALVGLQNDSTFTSYREARLHLWEDTILPLAEFIRLEFSNWLCHKFNDQVEIMFDLDAVHALMSRREILWNKISNADFLSTDEKRELLGFPSLNKGKKS